MGNEMAACPFCGGRCRVGACKGMNDMKVLAWVYCDLDGGRLCAYKGSISEASTGDEAKSAAIAAHNNLASHAQLGRDVEAAHARAESLTSATKVERWQVFAQEANTAVHAHRQRTKKETP